MDTKSKKRLDVLNQKLAKLRQRLAGELKQNDEPELLEKLRGDVKAVEDEIRELKAT